jgi:hypothetical protein
MARGNKAVQRLNALTRFIANRVILSEAKDLTAAVFAAVISLGARRLRRTNRDAKRMRREILRYGSLRSG